MKYFSSLSTPIFFYRCLLSRRSHAVIRRISIICLIGLMVSTACLIVIVFVMGGLGQSIKEKFLHTQAHVTITLNNVPKNNAEKPINKELQKNRIQQILKAHHLTEGLKDFYFFENVELIMRTSKGGFLGIVAKGYDSFNLKKSIAKQSLNVLNEESFNSSFSPSLLDMEGHKGIIINLNLAQALNIYKGDKVQLIPIENILISDAFYIEPGEVTSVIPLQNETMNNYIIFYDRKKFPGFSRLSSYQAGFEIYLKDPDKYYLYKKALGASGFLVSDWTEKNSSVFFALQIERVIMSLFLSLAGVITLLAISSLLVLLLVQKKKEIGILMVLGLSLKKIRRLFISTGFLLCALGAGSGVLLGLLISWLLTYVNMSWFIPVGEDTMFVVKFYPMFLVLFVISIGVLAFLSCWLSVRSQLKQNPALLLKNTHR